VNKATGILLLASTVMVSAQSLMGMRYPGGVSSSKTGFSSRMGGTGTGSSEPYLLMAHTPSNLGNINQSVYTLKLGLDFTRVSENGSSVDFARLVPDLVGFAFPLGNAGTFGVGFSKERGNDYYYKTPERDLAINPIAQDTLRGWTGYSRKTGITVWEAGWGHSAIKLLRPGLSYRRFYYSVEDFKSTKMANFGGTGDSIDVRQAGNSLRGGISGSTKKFSYGITATYNFEGDVTVNRTVTDIDTINTKSGTNYIPHLVNKETDSTYQLRLAPVGAIGVALHPSEKLTVGVDASMEFGEQAWTNGPKEVFYTNYQNALSVSAGAEFIPAPELIAPRYFEKIRYSGGARFSQLPVAGDYEFAINTGLGLPVGTSGLIDLGFEGGIRRCDDLSDVKENFFKFSLTTSGGKAWKKKPAQVY